MANAYLLHNLVPFLILIRNAVLLKAWRGRPSKPTLDVRPAPLMTNIERRTIAYMEAVLPWARFRAQVSTGAILAPKKELNRSKATTSFGIIFKDQKAVVRRCNNRPGSILATYIRETTLLASWCCRDEVLSHRETTLDFSRHGLPHHAKARCHAIVSGEFRLISCRAARACSANLVIMSVPHERTCGGWSRTSARLIYDVANVRGADIERLLIVLIASP